MELNIRKLNTSKPSNDYLSDDLKQFERRNCSIEELLIYASTTDCSDLYIKVFDYPYISRYGKLIKIPCVPTSKEIWMNFYDTYIKQELNAKYVRTKFLDTSLEIRIPEDNKYYNDYNYFRYRANLSFSTGVNIATFRMIKPKSPTFDDITFPEEVKNALNKALSNPTGISIISGATGSGKNLHKNTIIPTLFGHRKLKDIKVGDYVFSKNGNPTKVIEISSPEDYKFYKLKFSNGQTVKCGSHHLWDIGDKVVDTEELILGNYTVPLTEPVKYNKVNTKLNPSTIGKYTAKFIDKKVDDYIFPLNEFQLFDYEFKEGLIKSYQENCEKYFVNKLFHRPFTINHKYKLLVQDFKHILSSLGYHTSKIKKKKKLGWYFTASEENIHVVDYKEINGNYKDYICLSVDDPTHTFLCTEDYIITHNSTTFAACFNTFTRPGGVLDNSAIITLEDPIENLFKSTDTVRFTQKELRKDFMNYHDGIISSLREHSNVLLVGECRDKETITSAIDACRTAHQVASTFHASDCQGTIARMSYYLDNDTNLIYDLIINFNIVLSQTLVPQDNGYLVDTQYILFNDEIRKQILNILHEGKNVAIEIGKLFKNEDYIKRGLVKDWSYRK